MNSDFDLGDMTLGQGQEMCEILSRSNVTVMSNNGPDIDFGCVQCDLNLEDKTFVQGQVTTLGNGQQGH